MSTEPVRDTEPTRITQGEGRMETRFCGYPASLWTLQYRFRGTGTGFNVTATADSDDFAAAVTTTQTAAMSTGKYEWQAWATNIADTTVIRKIGEGTLTVELGFTSGSTGTVELRSVAKIRCSMPSTPHCSHRRNVDDDRIRDHDTGRHAPRKEITDRGARAAKKYWAAIVSRENQAERVRNGGKFMKSINANFFER
jgi:hypothetical protein